MGQTTEAAAEYWQAKWERSDAMFRARASEPKQNAQSLDYIGIIEGTDKTSLAADYLHHYERILAGIRNDPIQLLEIGIADGASLRTWEKFLPAAAIIGVDIHEGCRRFAGGRVTVEIGSQADPEFLSVLATKYQPNVIIDDGSHRSAHVFLTFERLFPALRPGGIYVIEDVFLHYGDCASAYHEQGGDTPVDYLSAIARRLTSEHFDPTCDEATKQLVAAIDRIEFIPRAIVIHKRGAADMRGRLDCLFEAATKAEKSLTWYHLSWILMTHDDLERAEFAAQQAIAIDPDRVSYWPRLSSLQAQRGKVAAAIETLQEGIRLDPGNASLRSTLAGLETRIGAGA